MITAMTSCGALLVIVKVKNIRITARFENDLIILAEFEVLNLPAGFVIHLFTSRL